MSFNSELIDLLKTNPRFVDDEGELLLAAVQDHAWKIDHDLIKLLLSKKEIKAKFFDEIEGHWVFNINTFLEYISQKNFLDNSYTRFRNRIGLTIGEKYLRERGEVSLVWAYKDTVLEGGQSKEEENRNEIFFNEVLAQDEINRLLDPKVLTNFTRYTAKGKQPVKEFQRDENGLIRENLILKGNNLLALHTLKTQFRGQVKLIYIDPPYNTGSDSFGYNDNFNHSTWLTFMKNRLEVAKTLLKEDGLILISVDDREQAYLKVIMDEIFGKDNTETMIWHKVGDDSGRLKITHRFRREHEYIHIGYINKQKVFFSKFETARDYKNVYTNPDNDPRGAYKQGIISQTEENSKESGKNYYTVTTPSGKKITRQWRMPKEEFEELNKDNRIYYGKNGDSIPSLKVFINENKMATPVSILQDFGTAKSAGQKLIELFNGKKVFNYPKPPELIIHLLAIATNNDDIIVDFHAGSGTTAEAVLELNNIDNGKRNFILCEQMEYIEKVTKERVKKIIENNKSGDFVYLELMKYNEAFMERIQAAKNSKELLKIWREMAEGSFLNWYVNPEMPDEAIKDFEAINDIEKQKKLLAELLDKNQLYVNLSEIDDAQFKVSKEDKALNKAFYGEA